MINKTHGVFWWRIKVVCGALLILGVLLKYFAHFYPTILPELEFPSRILVVLGGAIFLYHYVLIKRQNNQLNRPSNMITTGGFFSLIRHPMYFGDLIMYIGLALLACNVLSISVLLLASLSLIKQAKEEDAFLQITFPEQYESWSRKTRLVLPSLY